MGTTQRRTLVQSITAWLGSGLERVIPFDSRAHSWARRVETRRDLPESFEPFIDGLSAAARQQLPYMVLTPTFRGIGRRSEQEKLVCLLEDAMYVVEQREGRLEAARFPLHGACRVERGVLLLHSWITIHSSGKDGKPVVSTLRFNTVTEHLMTPFIAGLRAAPPAAPAANSDAQRQFFNFLAKGHYKFFSHGRNSIRPGDHVQEVLLQPDLRTESFRLFGYSISKRISPAHLTILTESELITIRDDDTQRWIEGSAPGAIWNYVPRQLIEEAAVSSSPTRCIKLQIRPVVGPPLESIFEDSIRAEVEGVVNVLMRSKTPD